MKKIPPYWLKLQNPKWQKKRLEIMERDNFRCVACLDSETTLNIHHGVYPTKGEELWEVPDETLWTLCKRCHGHLEFRLSCLRMNVAKIHPALFLSDGPRAKAPSILVEIYKFGEEWNKAASNFQGKPVLDALEFDETLIEDQEAMNE